MILLPVDWLNRFFYFLKSLHLLDDCDRPNSNKLADFVRQILQKYLQKLYQQVSHFTLAFVPVSGYKKQAFLKLNIEYLLSLPYTYIRYGRCKGK